MCFGCVPFFNTSMCTLACTHCSPLTLILMIMHSFVFFCCRMAFRIQTKINKLKAKMAKLQGMQSEVSRDLCDVSQISHLLCFFIVVPVNDLGFRAMILFCTYWPVFMSAAFNSWCIERCWLETGKVQMLNGLDCNCFGKAGYAS